MRTLCLIVVLPLVLQASEDSSDQKARIRGIRDYGKQGPGAIPKIEPYLQDRDEEVRWEAVKAIADIGTPRALGPLLTATADNQATVQIRATDGLVNFYLPGYLKTGWAASFKKSATALKGRFTDTNTDVVDAFVSPRADVVEALGKLSRGGASMESRANAARALGILRGKAALPELYEALHSKDDLVLYESLIAVQKIREMESGPKVQFLLRDLHERVQIAAIETTGILRNREALGDLRQALERARANKIRRAALTALAMMPDPANRPLFDRYFPDKDDGLRAAAAEGYARLGNASDLPTLEKAFQDEDKMPARLSLAFALVMLGKHELSEFSPLQYLVNTLNSRLYRDSAEPLLVELTRDSGTRQSLYPSLANPNATKEEKIRLARILGQTGDADTLRVIEPLKEAADAEVAQESVRAIRNIKARLP